MSLAGSSQKGERLRSEPIGQDQLPGHVNYFVGNDPSKWHADLPTYAKVRYASVYPGIDLVYHGVEPGSKSGNLRQLEYDFIVAPGVSPSAIRMNFSGTRYLHIAPKGDLILTETNGRVAFHKPVVYQEIDGQRHPVAGRFQFAALNTVSFRIGAYDATRPLVIDPVLSYSTYLGGSGMPGSQGDSAAGIAVDASGSAYVVGTTNSTDFPVSSGAYKSSNTAVGGSTISVTKFNPAGTALVYSTYLGATVPVSAAGIALDANKNAYIAGYLFGSSVSDYPVTKGAYSSTPASLFVTKLNATGNALVYSTYIGPGTGQGIAVDSKGEAALTGFTYDTGFPVTPGVVQPQLNGGTYNGSGGFQTANAFVTKLNAAGSALVYSTYLGGSGYGDSNTLTYAGDSGTAIASDSSGNIFVTGVTSSSNFPTTSGAFQPNFAGIQTDPGSGAQDYASNAFLTKLNPGGTALVYSTYLGGNGYQEPFSTYPFPEYVGIGDGATSIAVSAAGEAYIAGYTHSIDFPITPGTLSNTGNYTGTGFVSKFNADGSALDYSTYLGPAGTGVTGLAVGPLGRAFLTGAPGANFPQSADALPGQNCCVFVAKLNPDGTGLDYSTLLGSNGHTALGAALAWDSAGNVYVAGTTSDAGFLTTAGAFQRTYKGSANTASNVFVTKLALANELGNRLGSTTHLTASSSTINSGQPVVVSVAVTGSDDGGVPQGTVILSGDSDSSAFPSVTLKLNEKGTATWTSSSLPSGRYSLTAGYSGDSTHLASTATADPLFTVLPAPDDLIFVVNGSVVYGQSLSGSQVTVTDAKGTGIAGLTINFSGANLSFTPGSIVTDQYGQGSVVITPAAAGVLTAQASVSGTSLSATQSITVNPAALNVTMQKASRLYGGKANYLYQVAGLVGSDPVIVNPITPATLTSPVGTYPLTATISGPKASDYYVTLKASTLQIVKAPLNIASRNETMVYGGAMPSLTHYHFNGLLNGDTASVVSGAPILTATVTSKSPVGNYAIGVQVGTLTAQNYYFLPYSSGEGRIYVQGAPLTVTANSITIHHGDPIPPLTYTITGFVNGETAALTIAGSAALSTNATSASPAGKYNITVARGTLKAANYIFPTYQNAVFTVLP